jgi:hypothetical protein
MRLSLILPKPVAKAYLNLYGGGGAGEIAFGIAEDVMKSWKLEKDERDRRARLGLGYLDSAIFASCIPNPVPFTEYERRLHDFNSTVREEAINRWVSRRFFRRS